MAAVDDAGIPNLNPELGDVPLDRLNFPGVPSQAKFVLFFAL